MGIVAVPAKTNLLVFRIFAVLWLFNYTILRLPDLIGREGECVPISSGGAQSASASGLKPEAEAPKGAESTLPSA